MEWKESEMVKKDEAEKEFYASAKSTKARKQ